MFNKLSLLLERLSTSKKHSGAAEKISLFKLLRNASSYYFDRKGYAQYPLTIFITVNGNCNLSCRMCDVGQKKKNSMFYHNLKGDSSQDFPIDRFKSLIQEVKFFRPYISITTTEPLMYPYIFDAVQYARSNGLNMNITTNGVLVEKYIKEIIDSGVHKLSISIDGPAAIHDKMRGVPGTYERVLKGMRLLIEEKKRRNLILPKIYTTCYICDTNYAHLVELLEGLPIDEIEKVNIKHMVFVSKKMLEDYDRQYKGRHKVTVSCLPEDFSPENINIDVLYEQAKEIKRRFRNVCALHFNIDKKQMFKYYYRSSEFMDSTRCVMPWFVAQITANGDLIVQTRCYAATYGNIMNRPFLDVWNGQEFREFRRDLQKIGRFPACARCDGVLYR